MQTAERLEAVRRAEPRSSELPLALLVEDDRDTAEIARSMLRLCGFTVWHVERGGDALHIVSSEAVDLVVLDLALPDMDGASFIEVAQRFPGFRDVQVVVASAVHPESSPMGTRLKKLGVQHFVDKPFTVGRLRAKLKMLFPDAPVDGKLSAREAESLALPGAVELNGDRLPVKLMAATEASLLVSGPKLPRSAIVEVRLKHRQVLWGRLQTVDLAALAQVKDTSIVGGKALTRLDVQFARPPLEWARMVDELPDL